MTIPARLKRNANHLSTSAHDAKKPKANGSITSFFGVPKAKSVKTQPLTTSSPSPSFDKAKWVASLTPEQQKLLQLEIDTLHESWLAKLKEELVTPEFLGLKRFLQKEKDSGAKIFPPENEIYSWSRHTPLNQVKVVIVGQDPYHNHNQAHGLAFSVRPPTPAPPSLVNIYTGIKNDYPTFQPPPNKGGLLIPWAERGVLMLNTCLTVRAHQAASHSNKGWERFTQKAIDLVARVRTNGVVFLAWGSPAGKRVASINRQKHCVLQSVHPSPLSAHRGFFNNGHFKKCNEWLAERYGPDEVIDWSLTSKTNTTAGTSPVVVTSPSTASKQLKTDSVKLSEVGPLEGKKNTATKTIESSELSDEFDEDIDTVEALAATEAAAQTV
ncbi:uracil-DNA glycosylase [Aspergillus clavatus NRRL 1]|uniref:Uracil-DNA glycosylase n=1 Tax=Aspergillus clavatus (strain ATCC 1007 / CBS 513.65 / DSM 816 / NCTC 3887 / NRRL 1 / QM 1276 / 107) TaxID=344612 RepID=A1C5W9_ASPCL|nr:uracil DNA N-glycosylase, putative [Aspergillus clavatus NRRL 1]EAW13790.1 uracil DNA N-glycosylase, putative [Aspergillus clavatus NRRL 1]